MFNFKSKERVEYFIQKQQSNLENLAGKLIREINPPTHYNLYEFSDNYTKEDYLKLTFIYLEKIIVFIENEYSEYLNVNIKVPYRTILMKENLISNKLEYIKSKLLSEKLNDAILRITFEPLIKISTINIQESITYNEFNFCLTYIKELFCILKSNANEVETNKIEEWLYEINFNELSFFKYIVDNIIIDLEKLDSEFEKIDFLYSLLKKLNQIQTKNLISYNNKLPSNRVQIISWIEEEIDYLQKKIKLETKNTIPHQHEDKQKMLSGISVAQISYFFNLLVQTNIIKPKNQREIFKFIAENFKTSITETISSDSVSAKFYNVETGTKNAIREKIIEMLNHTKH